MRTNNYLKIVNRANFTYLILFISSVVAIYICYGLEVLNPSNIKWLMSARHDWGTHYLGWAFYRNEEWTFPIGTISNLYYPAGTNVGLTDSIPLLALTFKVFSPFLGDNFQYFGIWLLICFFLTMLYVYKILQVFNVNYIIILCACVVVGFNPVLVYRGLHPSLCSHFLIIASFYNFLRPSEEKSISINLNQTFLFFLSAMITPYMTAMIAGFNLIIPAKHYFFDKSIKLKKAMVFPVMAFISVYLFYIVLGLIQLPGYSGAEFTSYENFRDYSFNLNSFYNSYGYASKFIPGLPNYNPMQYEGFAFLGIGIMTMALTTIILVLNGFNKERFVYKNYYILIIGLLAILTLFSISNQVVLNNKIIFTYPIPIKIDRLASIFRASGRFIWPLYYAIFLFSFIVFSKFKIKKSILISLICILSVVQLYDTWALLTQRANFSSGVYDTPLSDNKWKKIFRRSDVLITYPSYTPTLLNNLDYQDFCYLALQEKRPITNGYVARNLNIEQTEAFKKKIENKLAKGIIGKEVYITTRDYLQHFKILLNRNKADIGILDNYICVFAKGKAGIMKKYLSKTETDRKLVDSLRELWSNDREKFKIILNDFPKGGVKFYYDNFNFKDNILQVKGWSFVEGIENNKGDSIFISFRKPDKSYILPANIITRPDITTAFKRKYLGDAGFDMTIFTQQLEKGKYDVGIIIKHQGKSYHSINDKKATITVD